MCKTRANAFYWLCLYRCTRDTQPLFGCGALSVLLFLSVLWGTPTSLSSQSLSGGIKRAEWLKYQHDSLSVVVKPIGDSSTMEKPSVEEKQVYSKIVEKASKRRFTRELVGFLIRNPDKIKDTDSVGNFRSDMPFQPFASRIISTIHVVCLDPFGTSIYDPSREVTNGLNRLGNGAHMRTKDPVIRGNLLFTEGDALRPELLADSERLLNDLSYVYNARIEVTNDPDVPGEVMVWVIVRDVWSVMFDIPLPTPKKITVGLNEKNLMGRGNQLETKVVWQQNADRKWGSAFKYRKDNWYGTFIGTELAYQNLRDKEWLYLQVARPFLTPGIRVAGGGYYARTSDNSYLTLRDSVKMLRNYGSANGWLGYSFPLKSGGNGQAIRKNLTFTASVTNQNFFKRPGDAAFAKRYYSLQNRTTFLGSVALSRQNFFTSSMIYNFGRIEYISTGSLLTVTGGAEHNEFGQRVYFGTQLSMGTYLNRFGYLAPKISASSFYNGSKTEQAVFEVEAKYFSPLHTIGRYKMRAFLNSRYTRGFHTYDDEYATLNRDYYFKGFYSDSVSGLKRFNLDLEFDFFTPWTFHGFRFVLFAGTQLGWIGDSSTAIFENSAYTSVSAGLRIRNEMLVFNTIQIRLAWFPNIPKDGARFEYFKFSDEPIYKTPSFRPEQPAVYVFR